MELLYRKMGAANFYNCQVCIHVYFDLNMLIYNLLLHGRMTGVRCYTSNTSSVCPGYAHYCDLACYEHRVIC